MAGHSLLIAAVTAMLAHLGGGEAGSGAETKLGNRTARAIETLIRKIFECNFKSFDKILKKQLESNFTIQFGVWMIF